MNTPTTIPPDPPFDSPGVVPDVLSKTRPLYWSIRRELWENRSIYIAPLVVMALVLLGSLIAILLLPHRIQALAADDPGKHDLVVTPFSMAPAPIMLTTFLVGVVYSLDALYGERRDRSILFWKSLPVSDWRTVLAKASIPVVVLPLIAFVLSVIIFYILLTLGTGVLLMSGMSPATLWGEVRFIQEPLIMIYGLVVHALWFAPIYCWLLLVSAWARRVPLLWAVLPLFGVLILERIVFRTSHFASLLRYRLTGAMEEAFGMRMDGGTGTIDQLSQLHPLRFMTSPGLWIGLAFAAAFLAGAMRLRRYREPI